ncbi:ABC transporter permease [Kitasatospora purpeofusca]|uniref:ABC transporter permease n=1 Tax=Kitasatospora purpeofusca TaxID=67352 RepID=UPI002A59D2D2|nr:ABC transporter permease [Kitasatospora purpeofusca]MDY0815054.1 ABC transporter permease [Kitasatospora purpeofusca]
MSVTDTALPETAEAAEAVQGAEAAQATGAAQAAEATGAVRRSPFRRPAPGVLAAGAWLALVALAALLVPLLPGFDPLHGDFAHPSAAPGPGHWLGTDAAGRDVLQRTVAGARASFAVAGLTIAVGLLGGGTLGLAAGWFRGPVDKVIGFATDLLMSVPSLILVMITVALRGPGLTVIGTLIGLFTVPHFTRMVRAVVLSLSERGFVQAARMIGTAPLRILRREVVPHVAPAALTFAFTATTVAIVAEGSLSFLGFGLRPPEPSWGGIIAEGRTTLGSAPWISLAPAAVLCLTVLALNYLGEQLRSKGGRG